ncbi:MAG TPA: glycosyltransferase family 39 protein [Tepidiformaceae bacterium]|nr:glycosyltransferase family 39 protein [Tepidiformaceae bacterium]
MSPKTDELQFFFRLVPVFLGIRLIYAAIVQLIPDEAFYWTWTRHLAAGYFDHPPMIAYLMWLGIRAVGSVEIGVRLMAVLMALGAMVIVVRLSRRVLGDPRAAVWVAVIWLTSPLLAGLANFFTPDTPAAFFSVCALSVAVLIAHRDDQSDPSPASWKHPAGLWLLFGLFTGLALLSKYTAVLLPDRSPWQCSSRAKDWLITAGPGFISAASSHWLFSCPTSGGTTPISGHLSDSNSSMAWRMNPRHHRLRARRLPGSGRMWARIWVARRESGRQSCSA